MKQYKIILVIVSFVTIFLTLLISATYSKNNRETTVMQVSEETVTLTTASQAIVPNEAVNFSNYATSSESAFRDQSVDIPAPYAVLCDLSSDEILYEKSIDTKIHPASITKILTAITALNYMDSDTVITVGTELEILPKHSSLCLIKKGHKLTLYDLLTGMLVSSGNDAAYAVAANVARYVINKNSVSDEDAISYFTDMMNSTAKFIGCTSSNFTTPDGFDNDEQYTTVRDLLQICKYAFSFKEIQEITSIVKKKVIFESGENVVWSNSNQLLHPDSPYYFSGATGMKTGTTPLAGKCLVATAEIDEQTYIAIVANCKSEDERYTSAIKLFEYFPRK